MLSAAADHDTTAIAAPDAERTLLHRGQNDQAFSFVEQVLRNVIRNVKDLLQHLAGFFHAVFFFLVVGRKSRQEKGTHKQQRG